MWPLAMQIAEREDGFECPDEAFDAIFGPLDRGVAGSRHLYDAMAPLVGVLVSEPPADLGRGVSLVRADVGDIAASWPEASLLVPPGFGGEPDRRCALAVTLELEPGERPPRLADLVEDAVRALRLVSGAAIATGPVGFERIDGGPRPPVALSLASSQHVRGRLLPLRPPPARGRARHGAAHRRARPRAIRGARRSACSSARSRSTPPLQADALRDALGVALGSERSLSLTALRAGALAGRDAGERQRVRDLVAGDIAARRGAGRGGPPRPARRRARRAGRRRDGGLCRPGAAGRAAAPEPRAAGHRRAAPLAASGAHVWPVLRADRYISAPRAPHARRTVARPRPVLPPCRSTCSASPGSTATSSA